MKSQKIKQLIFLFIILFIGNISNAQNYIGNKKQIQKIIHQSKMFSKYLVNGETDKLIACYTKDGKIFPSNSDIIQGHKSLQKFWKVKKGSNTIKHKVTPIELRVVKKTAYDYGYYEGTTLTTKGKEIKWKGKYVIVWKKVQGDWKIYLDIWNN